MASNTMDAVGSTVAKDDALNGLVTQRVPTTENLQFNVVTS